MSGGVRKRGVFKQDRSPLLTDSLMTENFRCPICGKRKPERFCPAKGEKICSVCCGTEREVTLDCPADCSYLIAAHRYEQGHRPQLAESEIPFPKVELSRETIYEQQPAIAGLGRCILDFWAERRELADPDVLTALEALAETYRTLVSGIYYAKPPENPLAAALYAALEQFLQGYKQQEHQQPGLAPLKDADAFQVLVFLARMQRGRANGRPRSRIFLNLLLAELPPPQAPAQESSRIILP
jgi:hypothetical protein